MAGDRVLCRQASGGEQRERYRSTHGGITGRRGMKMIAGVERGQQLLEMLWVAGDLIEVDQRIEVSRSSNPRIHRLPICLAGWTRMVVVRSNKRQYGRANDRDASRVRAHDNLLVCRYHAPNQCIVLGSRSLPIARQPSNVVDSLENNQIAHSRLRDNVVVDPGQCIWSQTIGEQVVSADPLIENAPPV